MSHAPTALLAELPASSRARLSRPARRERTAWLLEQARTLRGDELTAVQDEVIALTMPVAAEVARRYHDRGIPADDLNQVAFLGLTKAVRGFDPDKGSDLLSFAVPTIRGEIRKYFRDIGWTIRPPRRIQELQPQITAAESELFQKLGRSPRPSEIARHLGVEVEDVREALAANGCFSPSSLDAPQGEGESSALDALGAADAGFALAEARIALRPLLRGLSDRERQILELRFGRGMTQREIGEVVGVTQMQISRVLTQVLARLRERLQADTAA